MLILQNKSEFEYNVTLLNGILNDVGYTSYCADVYCYDFTSTGGDAKMQTLVSFTSASSFVKENNYARVMKYLPDIIKQLKDCPKSLRRSIILWMYFKVAATAIAVVLGGTLGSGLIKILVTFIRK